MRGFLIRLILRIYLRVHLTLVRVFSRLVRKRVPQGDTVSVQLTGTFYSDNWVLAHIRPLARAENCERVVIVTTHELTAFENVEIARPPEWQIRVFGGVIARLLTHLVLAFKNKPTFVGGFHLLFNGLASSLTASLCGARSLYFCVGGPAEVLDGGLLSENRLFEKIGAPDPKIESLLLRAVNRCDQIVTMGSGAKDFFLQQSVSTNIEVISGGIDLAGLPPQPIMECEYDLIFVGRLVPIKGLDLLLESVAGASQSRPDLRLVIVGDGPMRTALEQKVVDLNLENNVELAGFSENVDQWLARAGIFVLTSESEGLSLALMEAMASGLTAIVPDVGDLDNLVRTGVNGVVVEERTVKAYVNAIDLLLSDDAQLAEMRRQAMADARVHSVENCAAQWRDVLDVNLSLRR
tara:strand:- start:1350 stop:2573 length:1224 start_codon:yes stop_codon:yes gene_type:complete